MKKGYLCLKMPYICSQTRTTTAIYSLLHGKTEKTFHGTLKEKNLFLQVVEAAVVPGWDWIAGQKLASCSAETSLH